jgi:hypothetical protein
LLQCLNGRFSGSLEQHGGVDRQELRLYVDRKLDVSIPVGPGELNPTSGVVTIGHPHGSGSSEVWLDDVRLHRRAFSAEEIAHLYEETKWRMVVLCQIITDLSPEEEP